MPDGQVITIGNERFRWQEALFNPAVLYIYAMCVYIYILCVCVCVCVYCVYVCILCVYI
jgi:hypothetical protein